MYMHLLLNAKSPLSPASLLFPNIPLFPNITGLLRYPWYSPLSPDGLRHPPMFPRYYLLSPRYSPLSPQWFPLSPQWFPLSPPMVSAIPRYPLLSPMVSVTHNGFHYPPIFSVIPRYSPLSPLWSPLFPDILHYPPRILKLFPWGGDDYHINWLIVNNAEQLYQMRYV